MTEHASERSDRSNRPGNSSFSARFPRGALSWELARIDLVRGVRWLRTQDFWLLYGLLSAVGFLVIAVRGYWYGIDLATQFAAAGSHTGVLDQFAFLCGCVWLFTTVLFAVDGFGSNGDLAHDGQYLTVVPVPDLVGGKLLASACKFAVMLCVPAGAVFLGLALETGSPLPFAGGAFVLLATILSGVAIGFPIGLGAKGFVRRSTVLTRLKPVVGAAIGVVYVVSVVTGEFVAVITTLETVLGGPPFSWLAAIGLVTTPGAGVSLPAVVVGTASVAGTVFVGLLVAPTVARYAWLVTPTEPSTGGETTPSAPRSRLDAVFSHVCRASATATIASTTLRRIYRAPSQLVFVTYPLVAAIPMAEALLSTGTVPWYTPWIVGWYCAWAAGVAIPLNPLGNQGAMLPAVLTAPVTGHQLVRGHVSAAVVPTVPVAVIGAVGTGVAGGLPVHELLGVALVAVGALVVASVLAIGIGSVLPRFEHVDFGGSRRAVPPSKVAYGSFTTVFVLGAMAVTVVAEPPVRRFAGRQLSGWLPFGLTVDAGQVELLAWIVLLGCAVLVCGSYLVAVRRLGEYSL